MNDGLEGLIGREQKRLLRLAEAINKSLAPTVTATFQGEQLILKTTGRTLWLDCDFHVTGEAATPSSNS